MGAACSCAKGDKDQGRDDLIHAPSLNVFRGEILDAHNKYRKAHSADNLELDNDLNKKAMSLAKKHAKLYAKGKDDVETEKNNKNGASAELGICSWLISSNTALEVRGDYVVNSWYEELRDYDFYKPGKQPFTEHFTQLVWKNSKNLGVGCVISADGSKLFVVTVYDPPGNIASDYDKNVSKKSYN